MYRLVRPDNVPEIVDRSGERFPQRPFLGTKNKALKRYDWTTSAGLGELVVACVLGGAIGLAQSASTIPEDLSLVKPTFMVAVPRVFNKVYDGLWAKMNEEGGLARKLFVMGVGSGKKKRELAAQGASCSKSICMRSTGCMRDRMYTAWGRG